MVPCQTQLFETVKTISPGNRITSEFVSHLITKKPLEVVSGQSRPEISLDSIFPTVQEETKITTARRILEDISIDLSDDELEVYLTKFEYLLDTWLDSFEKQVFENKTLNQLLREG